MKKDHLVDSGVDLVDSGVDLVNSGVDLVDSGVDLVDSGVDIVDSGVDLMDSGVDLMDSGVDLMDSGVLQKWFCPPLHTRQTQLVAGNAKHSYHYQHGHLMIACIRCKKLAIKFNYKCKYLYIASIFK